MKYATVVSRGAAKFLKSVPRKDYLRIREFLISLESNPLPAGVNMLRGYDKVF